MLAECCLTAILPYDSLCGPTLCQAIHICAKVRPKALSHARLLFIMSIQTIPSRPATHSFKRVTQALMCSRACPSWCVRAGAIAAAAHLMRGHVPGDEPGLGAASGAGGAAGAALGSAKNPVYMMQAEPTARAQLWRTIRTLALALLIMSGVGALVEERGLSRGILNNPDLRPQTDTRTRFADVKGVDEAKVSCHA